MKFFVGGGALLDIELQRYFNAIGIPIFQGYGVSEATPVISANSEGHAMFGSSGRVVKPLDIKICDEDGNEVPVGTKGEIVVHGENVMAGYWKNPQGTAEALRKDSEGREVYITYRDYTYRFSKETPKFSLILVKNTSRFSRNILITDVLRKLAAIGVYVKFLDIDKSTENESDLTIIQFFQTFDEMFSRDLSRKLLSANEQARQNQILRSNYDLFGYQ